MSGGNGRLRPVEFWRMGLTPVPIRDVGRWAKRFEDLGWDGFAVGEGHGGMPDPYASLAAVASATTRLKVGTAVAVPIRHPAATANGMATVQAISGGRARFGIGRGDGAYLLIGGRPPSVEEFELYLNRVQGYLRGEEVPLDNGFMGTLRTTFMLDPSMNAVKPPLDVACTGPKMIALAARCAESLSFAVGADAERIERCIGLARSAREAAGLPADELSLGAYVQVVVCDKGEEEQARDMIQGLVMTHAHFSAYYGKPLDDVTSKPAGGEMVKAATVMNNLYNETWRSPEKAQGSFYPKGMLDPEFMNKFAIVGPPAYCAERLSELIALGVDRPIIGTRSAGVDLEERNTFRIAQEVFPLVNR